MNKNFLYVASVVLALSFQTVASAGDVFKTQTKPAPPKKQLVVVPPADSAFDDWVRFPYVEGAAQIVPTAEEQKLGCVIFSRPFVDAIYPETIPLPQERIAKVDGFGAWDQFETLNFALYPLVDLKNINVRVGDLTCGDAKIPSDKIAVRLVTYRDITYPRYSSKGAWRRLPEYLQPVTTSDAPAKEPQRFCLTIRVPQNIPGGVYSGKILLSHDAFDKAIVLPLSFRVLPFKPLRDPNKAFTSYYHMPYAHELVKTKKHDEAWADSVLQREIKTMAEYGHTRFPVVSLSVAEENGKMKFTLNNIDKYMSLMKENGMTGPMVITGGGIGWLYSKMTKKSIGNHIILEQMPPEAFFTQLEEMARTFAKEIKEKHYPAMYFGPLDEISSNELSIQFGCRVYEAFQKGGLKTYTTMEPENPGYKKIYPYIDVFSCQVFEPLYQEIQKRDKELYYCYPNHNSYERKDPVIMCKGGRMTYGFGLWRSGFDILIPWTWRHSTAKHFFRQKGSGGTNILHPETGDVILTTAWENFREGINDLNYIYTLEDAIVKRENSTDPATQKLVKQGKELLQFAWDSVNVQPKYLNIDLWPSDQFDSLRYSMGMLICKLNQTRAVNNKVAPSVIINPDAPALENKTQKFKKIYEQAKASDNIEVCSIVNPKADLLGWKQTEDEASVSLVPAEDGNRKAVKLHINVDLVKDGTGNKSGQYPAGWPGMMFNFKQMPMTTAAYDFVRLKYKLQSNRPKSDKPQKAPLSFLIRLGGGGKSSIDVECPSEILENQWIEVIAPMSTATYDGIASAQTKADHIRTCITERNYQNGDKLDFTFADIEFISLKKPVFASIELSPCLYAALGRVRYTVKMFGRFNEANRLKARLLDAQGKIIATDTTVIPEDKKIVGQLNFDSKIKTGVCQVRFELCGANDKVLVSKTVKTKITR